MNEYSGAMDNADEAIVFYSKHALELKRMPFLEPEKVKEGFNKNNLTVITDKKQLEEKLCSLNTNNTNFLFMSSGNYDGMDILKVIGVRHQV
jgi:UDP-N-acetylmuramate: L-alanyl-gamma-D-glutamyl-meso-diaminopimelate ligase